MKPWLPASYGEQEKGDKVDKRAFERQQKKTSKEISKYKAEHSVKDTKFKAAREKFRRPAYMGGKK